MKPTHTIPTMLGVCLCAALAAGQDKTEGERPGGVGPSSTHVLPFPDFRYQGSVGRTIAESDPPEFPQPVRPPKGAPNIVFILIDDCGYGQFGTFGGQGTYDPIQIKALVGGRAWEHPSIFKVYGVTTAEEALHPTAERQKLYDEAAAITHLTRDDPPLYMVYSEADGPLPPDARPGQGIHHPNFGRQLKKKMDELGIENVFVYTPEAQGRNAAAEMLQFFQKQFAKAH